MKARGRKKTKFSNSLVNWEKFESACIQKSKFSISFTNCEKLGTIHSPTLTFLDRNFGSMDDLGKVMS